jgi:hypothetical protein
VKKKRKKGISFVRHFFLLECSSFWRLHGCCVSPWCVRQWKSPKSLCGVGWARARALLAHCRKSRPFYRKFASFQESFQVSSLWRQTQQGTASAPLPALGFTTLSACDRCVADVYFSLPRFLVGAAQLRARVRVRVRVCVMAFQSVQTLRLRLNSIGSPPALSPLTHSQCVPMGTPHARQSTCSRFSSTSTPLLLMSTSQAGHQCASHSFTECVCEI